jgi:6-phosphogluconate dehydrogenase
MADYGVYGSRGRNPIASALGSVRTVSTLASVRAPADKVSSFVASLKRPRRVLVLIERGESIHDIVDAIASHLESGDTILDLSGEHHQHESLYASLQRRGVDYVDGAVSYQLGKEGCSIFLSGSKAVVDAIEPSLALCTHQSGEDSASLLYLGPTVGAAAMVKAVEENIKLSRMQLYSEIYEILRSSGALTNEDMAEVQ